MRQHLLNLNELQKIDTLIRDIDRKRESLPARLKELERSHAAKRQEAALLTQQRDDLERQRKAHEATIQNEVVKLRKWEQRLNEIRNQREYLALSREIEASKRANRDLEEKIAEIVKQREEIDTKIEGLNASLSEEDKQARAEQDRVKQELAEVESTYQQESKRRQEIAPSVPKSLLRKYDMVRAKRDGIGIVAVNDGSCLGCNMRLPPQLYNMLQRGDTAEQCPSCQRIIFWEGILESPSQQKDGASAEASA